MAPALFLEGTFGRCDNRNVIFCNSSDPVMYARVLLTGHKNIVASIHYIRCCAVLVFSLKIRV